MVFVKVTIDLKNFCNVRYINIPWHFLHALSDFFNMSRNILLVIATDAYDSQKEYL